VPGDVVGGRNTHANTNFLCIQAAAANTEALTEPGAGSDWASYWIVLGHRVNNPDAFTGVTEDDDAGTVTLLRAGGENPVEINIDALVSDSPSSGGRAGGILLVSPEADYPRIVGTSIFGMGRNPPSRHTIIEYSLERALGANDGVQFQGRRRTSTLQPPNANPTAAQLQAASGGTYRAPGVASVIPVASLMTDGGALFDELWASVGAAGSNDYRRYEADGIRGVTFDTATIIQERLTGDAAEKARKYNLLEGSVDVFYSFDPTRQPHLLTNAARDKLYIYIHDESGNAPDQQPVEYVDRIWAHSDAALADTVSAYHWRAKPPIPAANVAPVTAQQNIAADAVFRRVLVDDWEAPGGIQPGYDFWTFWDGTLTIDIGQNNRNAEIVLETTHKFGTPEKTLKHTRSVWIDLPRDAPQTVAMAAFNSLSTVRTGSYQPPGGGAPIEITAEDLASPSKISYAIEVRFYNRNNRQQRATARIDNVDFDNIETISYQLRQGVTAPPLVAAPSITRFDVTGTQHVSAGTDISGRRYTYDAQIAHAAQAETVRIVGYAGALNSNPGVVHVLDTFDAADFAHKMGSVTIPANTAVLANVGDAYNIALQVFAAGLTPGRDAPTAHQDWRITAIAASAQVHFGWLIDTSGAADIVFADNDVETRGVAAGTWTTSGAPEGDNEFYRNYLAVPESLTQPAGFTSAGLPASASWDSAVDRTVDGVAYKFYLVRSDLAVSGANLNGSSWGVT